MSGEQQLLPVADQLQPERAQAVHAGRLYLAAEANLTSAAERFAAARENHAAALEQLTERMRAARLGVVVIADRALVASPGRDGADGIDIEAVAVWGAR